MAGIALWRTAQVACGVIVLRHGAGQAHRTRERRQLTHQAIGVLPVVVRRRVALERHTRAGLTALGSDRRIRVQLELQAEGRGGPIRIPDDGADRRVTWARGCPEHRLDGAARHDARAVAEADVVDADVRLETVKVQIPGVRQPRVGASTLRGIGREFATDHHVGHIGGAYPAALASGDGALLAGFDRLRLHGDGVGGPGAQPRGEHKARRARWWTDGDGPGDLAIQAQHQALAGQAADRAADSVVVDRIGTPRTAAADQQRGGSQAQGSLLVIPHR